MVKLSTGADALWSVARCTLSCSFYNDHFLCQIRSFSEERGCLLSAFPWATASCVDCHMKRSVISYILKGSYGFVLPHNIFFFFLVLAYMYHQFYNVNSEF